MDTIEDMIVQDYMRYCQTLQAMEGRMRRT